MMVMFRIGIRDWGLGTGNHISNNNPRSPIPDPRSLVFLLFIFFIFPLAAMDWPVTDAALVRNFGFNDQGKPVLGSVFAGEEPALVAEAGELIFYRQSEDAKSRLPSPLGAWAAVDHGDGLISLYTRLDDAPAAPPEHLERGDIVAQAGMTGWSARKGFYFILYDKRERRWVNPSMIISPLPDTRPPQILALELRDSRGRPSQPRNLSQGRYTVTVNAVDTMLSQGERPLAPHRIICSINGTEIGSLDFETICARDGLLLVNRSGIVPAKQVYALFPFYEAGEAELSRGQATLEVIVQDIAGNVSRSSTRMLVE
jgi:hypothetical protein